MTDVNHRQIPLFPLGSVLLPGGRLPLRIFEPRYLAMVSACMQKDQPFGVVLIRRGRDVRHPGDAGPPEIFGTGTLASVEDFNTLADGHLGIVIAGKDRFLVRETDEAPDQVLWASVECLPEESSEPLGEQDHALVDTLAALRKHPAAQLIGTAGEPKDAAELSWRLAELLPVAPANRQTLLEMTAPRERLDRLTEWIARWQR